MIFYLLFAIALHFVFLLSLPFMFSVFHVVPFGAARACHVPHCPLRYYNNCAFVFFLFLMFTFTGHLQFNLELLHGCFESKHPSCGRLPLRNRSRRPLRRQESRQYISMYFSLRAGLASWFFPSRSNISRRRDRAMDISLRLRPVRTFRDLLHTSLPQCDAVTIGRKRSAVERESPFADDFCRHLRNIFRSLVADMHLWINVEQGSDVV